MVAADWHWWTYIKIGDYVASRGCIQELNCAARWIRYQKVINFPTDGVWDKGVFEGPFDEIWVDPSRSILHSREDIEGLDRGIVPKTYIRLDNMDPKDYFKNERRVLSSYLPVNHGSQSDE
ncbi:hypothetical protein [Prosthecobacter sp.]|uniref:hypothetical protein n=1 Tax=Prosthecobacter sp. TaxID=1965333 RepID=UPI003783BD07